MTTVRSMTTTQTPTAEDLQARFQVFNFALASGLGDAFFAEGDPNYLAGMKDTIEFLATGQTPIHFGLQ